ARLAVAQTLAREVKRYQRRRAGGVDSDRGSLQSEQVRDTAGRHAAGNAGREVAVDVLERPLESERVVVLVAQTQEHTGRRAVEPVRCNAGVLERLPCDLQQQPLLWVHADRFARRDPEEPGVELLETVEETAPPRRHAARLVRIGRVQPVDVPPLRRYLAHGVHALA